MSLRSSEPHSPFVTSNFDLAVTKLACGAAVRYTGPHQGVFRFECMRVAALKAAREGVSGEPVQDAETLRRFFTLH